MLSRVSSSARDAGGAIKQLGRISLNLPRPENLSEKATMKMPPLQKRQVSREAKPLKEALKEALALPASSGAADTAAAAAEHRD